MIFVSAEGIKRRRKDKLRFTHHLRAMITRAPLAMAISLAGLLALAGCSDTKPEDTRYLENRPPTPPNCPDLTELKNVTLKDGTVVDVRIVQFRDTKLYFPAWLMKGQFVEQWRDSQTGFIKKDALGNFKPDIHSSECPGVVHQIADETRHAKGIYPMIGIEIAGRDINPQFLSESETFWALRYGLVPKTMTAHAKFVLGRNQKIKFNDDVVVQMVVSPLERGVVYESQSVLDLTSWLMTPPAQRDNDRKFILKIDRVVKGTIQ